MLSNYDLFHGDTTETVLKIKQTKPTHTKEAKVTGSNRWVRKLGCLKVSKEIKVYPMNHHLFMNYPYFTEKFSFFFKLKIGSPEITIVSFDYRQIS